MNQRYRVKKPSDWGKIESLYRKAYKIARKLGEKSLVMGKVLMDRGKNKLDMEKYDAAISDLDEALKIFTTPNRDRAQALHKKGEALLGRATYGAEDQGFTQQDLADARATLIASRTIKEREDVKDAFGIAISNHTLGLFFEQEGNNEAALDHFERSFRAKTRQATGDSRGIFISSCGRARCLARDQKFEEATAILNDLGKPPLPDLPVEVPAEYYETCAVVAQEQGDYEKAAKWVDQAIQLWRETGRPLHAKHLEVWQIKLKAGS